MTDDEMIALLAPLEVDGRAVEHIYRCIIMGLTKDQFRQMTPDEDKFWDILAQDMKDNPAPEGSFYDIPHED